MRITDIDTLVVGNRWKNWIFVQVHTDAGLTGLGEVTEGVETLPALHSVREMAHLAIGLDPRNPVAVANALYRALYLNRGAGIAGIEIACWDILGQALDVPVWQLLGGKVTDRVRAYANGWYSGPRTPEAYAESAAAVIATGYTALKFDPFGAAQGFLDPDDEDLSVDIVAAVRETVGSRVDLLIEAHDRFSVAAAIGVARRLEPYRPMLIEAPVMSTDIEATIEVARRISIPVATGERFRDLGPFGQIAASRAVSILQPETLAVGGISQTVRVAAIAEAYGAFVAPHNAQSPLTTLANLHIDTATTNALIQETFDDFTEPWVNDLLTGGPQVKDGHFVLPTDPGLGARLNLDVALAHPYSEDNMLRLFDEDWQYRNANRPESR